MTNNNIPHKLFVVNLRTIFILAIKKIMSLSWYLVGFLRPIYDTKTKKKKKL